MESNLYALEKQVDARLEEARVAGQRAALYASARGERPGLWQRVVSLVAVRPDRELPRRMTAGRARI